MPFVKGQSGNPAGRPKATHDVKTLAKSYGKEAVEKLAAIMREGESDKVQAAAAVALLDRGYGRPMQTMDVTTRRAVDEIPEELIDAAIERLAAAGRSATEGGDAGAATGPSEPEQAPPVSTVH